MPKLKVMNFGGWETLVNKEVAVAPYLSSLLRKRVHKKQATNIVVTGEPGEGKSYEACDIARVNMGLTKTGMDRFKLKQVVFTYSQYLGLIIDLPMGYPIVFDEPSFAMGKRDWYKELNKALVLTIESQRFKVHPLFIPIINKSLLDKTIRNYLIQFQIEMRVEATQLSTASIQANTVIRFIAMNFAACVIRCLTKTSAKKIPVSVAKN